nr:MAG TPA: hypothetical protein [Caudoviricetes sp.]
MSNIHVPVYKLEPDDLIEKKPANDDDFIDHFEDDRDDEHDAQWEKEYEEYLESLYDNGEED